MGKTRLKREASLDAVQVELGHKHAAATEIYAEADMRRATDLVLRHG